MNVNKLIKPFLNQPYTYVYIISGLLVFVFYYSLSIPIRHVGFLSDDAIYLLMADIYSPWFDSLKPVYGFLVEHNRFPPLYPLMLALLGSHSGNAALAANITMALWCLGFVVTGLWFYQETRSHIKTIMMVLICSFMPPIILMSQELWSESLYFLLSFFFLYMLTISNKESAIFTMFCSLLICLVLLTRSIGVALCLAFFIDLIIKRPYRWQINILFVSLFYIVISVMHQLNSSTISYTAELLSFISEIRLEQYTSMIVARLHGLWQAWCWLFTLQSEPEITNSIRIVLAIMLLLTVCGFTVRLLQQKIDATYTLIYLCMILLWPYSDIHFQSRFHVPLLPLYIFYIYSGIEFFVRHLRCKQFCQVIIALLCFSVVIPVSSKLLDRAYTSVTDELKPYSRNRGWLLADNKGSGKTLLVQQHKTVEILQELSLHIPPYECVLAIQAPVVMLYSKLITGVYPMAAKTDWERFVRESTCRYLLAVNLVDHRRYFPPLFPCRKKLDNKSVIIRRFYIDDNNHQRLHMCLIELAF